MAWQTIADLVSEQIEQGFVPSNHQLLGFTIVEPDGKFVQEIPSSPDTQVTWVDDLLTAQLLPDYEQAKLVAKVLRGPFRPAVVTGVEGERQHFFLHMDADPDYSRPKRWLPLYPVQLKELIEEGEIPAGAKFKGYVLRIIASDEYLAAYSDDSYSEGWKWGIHPGQAKVFKDFQKACKLAKRHGQADVFPLVDTGEQYMVFEPPVR